MSLRVCNSALRHIVKRKLRSFKQNCILTILFSTKFNEDKGPNTSVLTQIDHISPERGGGGCPGDGIV